MNRLEKKTTGHFSDIWNNSDKILLPFWLIHLQLHQLYFRSSLQFSDPCTLPALLFTSYIFPNLSPISSNYKLTTAVDNGNTMTKKLWANLCDLPLYYLVLISCRTYKKISLKEKLCTVCLKVCVHVYFGTLLWIQYIPIHQFGMASELHLIPPPWQSSLSLTCMSMSRPWFRRDAGAARGPQTILGNPSHFFLKLL